MDEFAIVVPILILLFIGITELGRALYQENTLTHAVQAGARYMARVHGIVDVTTCAQQSGWSSAETIAKNIVVFGTPDSGTAPIVPNLTTENVTISQTMRSVSVAGVTDPVTACAISVHAEAPFASIFGPEYTVPPLPLIGSGEPNGIGGIGAITLNADTEERYIGE